jgi:hypothetical protein
VDGLEAGYGSEAGTKRGCGRPGNLFYEVVCQEGRRAHMAAGIRNPSPSTHLRGACFFRLPADLRPARMPTMPSVLSRRAMVASWVHAPSWSRQVFRLQHVQIYGASQSRHPRRMAPMCGLGMMRRARRRDRPGPSDDLACLRDHPEGRRTHEVHASRQGDHSELRETVDNEMVPCEGN